MYYRKSIPSIHLDTSRINHRRRGRYILRAWFEGNRVDNIDDFIGKAITEYVGQIPSGISIGTCHEIVDISRNDLKGRGLCVDFVIDILYSKSP